MIWISAWVMALATMRDKVALVLAFVLPPLLFIVFAAIFSGTTGKDLKLKVGLRDVAHTPTTERLVRALKAEGNIRLIELPEGGETEMVELVRRGGADVGLLIRGDLERRPEQGPSPVLIVENRARPLAGVIGIGTLQRTLAEQLPDVTLARILADAEAAGQIGKEDRDALTEAIHEQSAQSAAQPANAVHANPVFERLVTDEGGGRHANVLYYAGAVTSIFLLFGAVHGGLTLVDERRGGIAERLMISRSNFAWLVAGKFLFLTVQGAIQAAIVYIAAYLIYDAGIAPALIGNWIVAALLASAASAALALLVCALCRSRKQAEGLTTFTVLLVSAAGGSMVPRYLMPPWLQDLSWITPNAWIIDTLERAVLPGVGFADLAVSFGVLGLTALICGGLAAWVATWRPAH